MVIVVAGASGNLGGRIVQALRDDRSTVVVRALVRKGSGAHEKLEHLGAKVIAVDWNRPEELAAACAGATCVVSALAGLEEVILDAQIRLFEVAVAEGVERFIPSDYCLDFTGLPPGSNRNLDLRREFHRRIAGTAGIRVTSIFNGAFADMLTGQMPLLLFKLRRVLYWGDADQQMDFTTMDDTAGFTALAALDPEPLPRYLRIAGSELSARELAAVASQAMGKEFGLLRAGGLGMLATMIRIARWVAPVDGELYPAWQGMQYMHNMLEGRGKLRPLDNGRYPQLRFTEVREVLAHYRDRVSASSRS